MVKKIGFFIPQKASLLGLDCAADTLRLANRTLVEPAYQWLTISQTAQPVRATNGLVLMPDTTITDQVNLDMLFVCGCLKAADFADTKVLSWLRTMAQGVEVIGGITTGAFILARAGLLDGYTCTTHWEEADMFHEMYPQITISDSIFVIDRNRMTSAGGLVTIDLFLQIIARDCNAETTLAMASAYQLDRLRGEEDRQSWSVMRGRRKPPRRILLATKIMEQNIENPATIDEIADASGTSVRQLHRAFVSHLLQSPSEYYRHMRLHKARQLIRATNLSLTEVSLATGYSSQSAFSRSYANTFGHTPSDERFRRPDAPNHHA